MRFGHFDDARREYVIDTPRTPLPWINYLGSEDFFSLVSNTGGGYSFYRDARLRRLTRYRYNNSPLDMDGHRIYINDGGTIWNPGWQPAKTELDRYTCRHGLGYTILQGEKNGIAAAQELFVPRGDACEIDRLTLENKTAAPRTLDVFSYVEFCLWDAMDDSSNFQRNFSTGEVEVVESAIYHKTEYRERRDHYAVFWANAPVTSFDTSRDAFCGVYGGPAAPEAVKAGHCSNSIAHGWAPVGAHHFHLTLAPGEKKSVIFGLGYIETRSGKIQRSRHHQQSPGRGHDGPLCHRRAGGCRPQGTGRLLAGAALGLAADLRRGKAGPDGEPVEPVSVHGHLQHEPQCQLLRERHRPRHGVPGFLSGSAGLRPHDPFPRTGTHSGHCCHPV